jgi:phage tail-like protein
MALPETDSSVGQSFGLELSGIQIKSIIEVSGLKIERDVIEYRSNTPTGEGLIRRLLGRWKSGEFTVTRPLTADNSFDKLISQDRNTDARKDGAVVVYDFEGRAIKRYRITGVLAKSTEVSSTKNADTSVLTEKLVLTYEKCEPEGS